MKNKIILLNLSALSLIAGTDISYQYAKKEYTNSKFKDDGVSQTLKATHNTPTNKIVLQVSKDTVNLKKHPLSDQLEVEKYAALYQYKLDEKVSLKGSFLKIDDNLAPTDQGKIYSLGIGYNIPKIALIKADIYKSDYETFDVNQYDLSVSKGMKIGEGKVKLSAVIKSIQIDGDTYNGNDPLPKQYDFYKKDYLTYGLKLRVNYQDWKAGVATFVGKRLFGVYDDGLKVQHHAMEQDKTYMVSVGKSFNNFHMALGYNYQNGIELPEKQKDVDTKVTSFTLFYKF